MDFLCLKCGDTRWYCGVGSRKQKVDMGLAGLVHRQNGRDGHDGPMRQMFSNCKEKRGLLAVVERGGRVANIDAKY